MALTLAFMGTPDFALPSLSALIEAGHRIALVYTRPPRPAGRGRAERRSPVHAFAAERGLNVLTPERFDAPALDPLRRVDLAVTVAYGMILPKPVLEAPRLGCINLHASILPRWRGAAPIQRAIMAGDETTGVTIIQMDEGLDTGPILLAAPMPITPETTAGELHDGLARLGARLLVEAVAGLEAGRLTPRPQPREGVTYAKKIQPEEERLDWSRPATELARLVRALAPRPGAWFPLEEERVKVLAAEAIERETHAAPGTVLDARLAVACGEGALRLLRLKRAGRRELDAGTFLLGRPVPAGTRLR